MKSYLHPNSSNTDPTLNREALDIYRAIVRGQPITMANDHFTPEDLETVAERLRCDEIVNSLRALGVDASVAQSSDAATADEPQYVGSSVSIAGPDVGELHGFDSEAAKRVLQRLEHLSLRDAIDRTMEQCNKPVLSEHRLQELDRECDAIQRRLARESVRTLQGINR